MLFYHLERAPLERVLPSLLEKTLERGWRAVVQSGSEERLEALDLALWTYADDSFLPHGTRKDGNAEHQPIYLTTSDDEPNGAGVRFLVDGARDATSRAPRASSISSTGVIRRRRRAAREQWQKAKAAGLAVTYWRQSEAGRWEKQG